MLLLVDGEFNMWRTKASRVAFHATKIVFKEELIAVYMHLRPSVLLCHNDLASLTDHNYEAMKYSSIIM